MFSVCFIPPRQRLPQWLLLLTSKPFELNPRYLGQRKYRSVKMYWMTFLWPWLKVVAVALINKKWLFCRIKWEPLNQSLQNLVAISLWSCSLPGWILEEFCCKLCFAKFSLKILNVFFKVKQPLYWTYLRNGWSDWYETKKEVHRLDI